MAKDDQQDPRSFSIEDLNNLLADLNDLTVDLEAVRKAEEAFTVDPEKVEAVGKRMKQFEQGALQFSKEVNNFEEAMLLALKESQQLVGLVQRRAPQLMQALSRELSQGIETRRRLMREAAEIMTRFWQMPNMATATARVETAFQQGYDEAVAQSSKAVLGQEEVEDWIYRTWRILRSERPAISSEAQNLSPANLLLTILVAIVSLVYSSDQLQQTRKKIEEKIEYTASKYQPVHVVKDSAKVRAKNSVDSEAQATLGPGSKVEQVEWEGKWVQVRYFNEAAGKHQWGWILADRLQSAN